MKQEKNDGGIWFNGRFITAWSGVYDGMTTAFFRGGLPGVSRTIKCDDTACVCTVTNNNNNMAKIYRIRKLTARECFRLMAVKDDEIDKIQSAGISESQQYKLAGNSIVVDTLLHGIYIPLFAEQTGDIESLF